MAKKFMIFKNAKDEAVIVLADVSLHKYIQFPEGYNTRCGGGRWSVNGDTLRLYERSYDFGKYDAEMAQKAFDAKNVIYNGLPFDTLGVQNIEMDKTDLDDYYL